MAAIVSVEIESIPDLDFRQKAHNGYDPAAALHQLLAP